MKPFLFVFFILLTGNNNTWLTSGVNRYWSSVYIIILAAASGHFYYRSYRTMAGQHAKQQLFSAGQFFHDYELATRTFWTQSDVS
jgi:hypothetical protein